GGGGGWGGVGAVSGGGGRGGGGGAAEAPRGVPVGGGGPGPSSPRGPGRHYPEEAPAHPVTVGGFWIDTCPVTNAEFARFVRKTGHVTVAEQAPDPADHPGARPELLVPASTPFAAPPHRVNLAGPPDWRRPM